MPQLFVAAASYLIGGVTAAGVATAGVLGTAVGATAVLGTTVATIVGYAAYTAVTMYAINALQKKAMNKARAAAASITAAQKGYGLPLIHI